MNETNQSNNEEITLKELILKLKGYWAEIIRSWWIIGLFCIVGVLGFTYNHLTHIPIYQAELRFVVEGQSSGGGGLGSLLGSFGIKKGGKVNPYKIIEVGKSTSMLLKTLFHKLPSNINVANTILQEYDLTQVWSKTNPEFENFRFGNIFNTSESRMERSAIKKLRARVWGSENVDPMTSLKLNDETGIYTLSSETISEELSLAVTNNLYDEIKLFFEEEVFQNQKQLADILTMKADSIKTLNESKVRQIAKFEDSNRGMVSNESMVTKKLLTQESMALNVAYAEIMKNKEMTDVNLKDMQPLFMAIDIPFSPIRSSSSSLFLAIIQGLSMGGFLAIFFITIRKIYTDAMSN
ncbi:hypothetical protein N8Y88_00345 [Saprospiraceae bacterium]|nr:hypothetical protein [Saprospiraceae bacterium]